MSDPSGERAENDRKAFIADPGVLDELGVGIDELADPDMRAYVFRHEHAELTEAIESGAEEVDLGDGPMNPRLHLTMHEVVAGQLWDDSPPEVWDTAVRLLDAGYERHEILHMLASPMVDQIWSALQDKQAYDEDRHIAALDALPGSWEQQRPTRAAPRQRDDARRRARRAAKAARRGNRGRR